MVLFNPGESIYLCRFVFCRQKKVNKALINYVIISFAVIALTIFLLINIRLDYTRTYSEFIGIVYNAK